MLNFFTLVSFFYCKYKVIGLRIVFNGFDIWRYTERAEFEIIICVGLSAVVYVWVLSCMYLGVCLFVPLCAPWSCHQVSRYDSWYRWKPASRLIRAGIQPPWLHLTISHQATYSIISCLNWRALLSLTQADWKFPFISYIKPACCSQTKQAQQQNAYTVHYDYKLGV